MKFWVWPTDADRRYMNAAKYLLLMEMGRLDLMVRSGFIWRVIKENYFLPVAAAQVQYMKPVRRWRTIEAVTAISYWDDKWIYLSHELFHAGEVVAVARVRAIIKKGREVIPYAQAMRDIGHQITAKPMPAWVSAFDQF